MNLPEKAEKPPGLLPARKAGGYRPAGKGANASPGARGISRLSAISGQLRVEFLRNRDPQIGSRKGRPFSCFSIPDMLFFP